MISEHLHDFCVPAQGVFPVVRSPAENSRHIFPRRNANYARAEKQIRKRVPFIPGTKQPDRLQMVLIGPQAF